ncbi:DUF294 nucleotidyltransferase-like domain-containing protein [Leucothrix pacifica]|uniref:Nucleotidyltransferase n=1 Tax=Leucothrix pacifica TaxID=1247513 RepID=A0A317CJT0_9GAMM|nr:DUF294 nucleotidyltransferase-like domain-containing protein [Leucothrix pacifica]PWQ98845.1 hypothetical protein DKW60_07315 [Leucothrix pacifica]
MIDPSRILADIDNANDLATLQQISQQVPELQIQITQQGRKANELGRIISSITTEITIRLIQLAEQQLGPPPVPYAWIVAGSQAREEQTSHTDQDTGLVISNAMRPEHDAWFESLARFVSDGLNSCGYIYCPGDVMASNPKWRQTQNGWREHFHQWIDQPRKRGLMYSSIFFDLRAIYGDISLWDELHSEVLQHTRGNSLFLAQLSSIALHHRAPLGLFNRFQLCSEPHADTVDIKHGGIIPIVDMARIFALETGVLAVNTRERLQQTAGSEALSHSGSQSLLAAFDFLHNLRANHQLRQLLANEKADNYINPKALCGAERKQLRASFKVIRSMQRTIKSRLGDGLLDE